MHRLFLLVAALTALLAAEATAQPREGLAPFGSYRDSCRNVLTFPLGDDTMLTAECRDERGRWRGASLRVGRCREVVNRDGDLMCRDGDGRPPYGGGNGGGYGGGRPPFGGGTITLFSGVDFGGQAFQSRDEVTNLPRQYNDKAMSLKIEGRGAWMVCSDSDFEGRCQTFDHDIRDLRQFGLGEAISSMRPVR